MRFSILIPTYNRAKFLKQAISSILAQTFQEYELIIANDGSTDDTEKLLDSYKDRIISLNLVNGGAQKALNAAAELSNGEYLAFLDDDDIYSPYALQAYNKIIAEKNNPAFIVGQPIFFKDQTCTFTPPRNLSLVTYGDYFCKDRPVYTTCSMMIVRRDIFYEAGGFRESFYAFGAHYDFDFILRVGTYGPAIVVLEPRLFGYRFHSSNSVRDIGRISTAICGLIDAEKAGIYPGGSARKMDRHKILGGTAAHWMAKALVAGELKEGIKLLWKSYPMIAISLFNKITRHFKCLYDIERILI